MRLDIHRFCAVLLFIFLSLVACSSNVKAPVTAPGVPGSKDQVVRPVPGDQDTHVVRKGDTLYSIAWRYGKDFRSLANWNNINPPYIIYPGQIIHLKSVQAVAQKPARPPAENNSRTTIKGNQASQKSPPVSGKGALPIEWRWPTSGQIVKMNLPTLEKGLNISGTVGQEIKAAAAGEVVYSGSGLLGYGKLIIIKHSEIYLSAYAHNDRILIKEGMKVTSGQKIATMGIGNNGTPLLHFEIRKEGKPVDPIIYLPKQRS